MSFGFKNVTATDVEAEDGTKVAASVIFPDDFRSNGWKCGGKMPP
jgi:hypothetical protein